MHQRERSPHRWPACSADPAMLIAGSSEWEDLMGNHPISRRDAMLAGGGMVAGLAFLRLERLVEAVGPGEGEVGGAWGGPPRPRRPPPPRRPRRSSASSCNGKSWIPG